MKRSATRERWADEPAGPVGLRVRRTDGGLARSFPAVSRVPDFDFHRAAVSRDLLSELSAESRRFRSARRRDSANYQAQWGDPGRKSL